MRLFALRSLLTPDIVRRLLKGALAAVTRLLLIFWECVGA